MTGCLGGPACPELDATQAVEVHGFGATVTGAATELECISVDLLGAVEVS